MPTLMQQAHLPGIMPIVKTAGTNCKWCTLESWYEEWENLHSRSSSRETYHKQDEHLQGLVAYQVELISACQDLETLERVYWSLKDPYAGVGKSLYPREVHFRCYVPARGQRADHPTTPLIMRLKNQMSAVEKKIGQG